MSLKPSITKKMEIGLIGVTPDATLEVNSVKSYNKPESLMFLFKAFMNNVICVTQEVAVCNQVKPCATHE